MASITETERNYRDLYSYKAFVQNVLIPKWFPDKDVSNLNVGLMGLITEMSGISIEDTFNTVSTFLKEFFPNRASLPESIYTYAGLFQLSDAIGKASQCTFLMVLNEKEMNAVFDQTELTAGVPSNTIFISKNTVIYLGDTPFALDYDVELTRKRTKLIKTSEWSYGAKYVTTPYKNSISAIISPYIKIRKSIDGYIALEVITHQCERTEYPFQVTDIVDINYTVFDVDLSGKILAGFDVFYKAPTEEEYIQLDTLVVNALPQKEPFCYFKVSDEDNLQISFAMSSSNFQPEFGSDIKVVVYTTLGEDGSFDQVYSGHDISVEPDRESYSYNNNFLVAAVPVTPSIGGKSSITIEDLQKKVVERFSTANALTTDNDLEIYFHNYEYNMQDTNSIKFLKRRDDFAERLYTGFLVMRNEDYIYPTNTLDVRLNYFNMANTDGGYIYTLDPGHVFEYDDNKRRVRPLFKPGFMDRKEYINFQGQSVFEWMYRDYFFWLRDIDREECPDFNESDPEWEVNWIPSKKEGETFKDYIEKYMYECQNPNCGFHSYHTFTDEEGNEVCPCCHTGAMKRGGGSMGGHIATVYDNDPRFEEKLNRGEFLYANPFLMSITRYPGILNYFLTVIDQTSLLDFIQYNSDTPLQFIINQIRVYRELSREKEYTVILDAMPSIEWDVEQLVPGITKEGYVGKRSMLKNNCVRIVMVIQSGAVDVAYLELIPIKYTSDDHIVFSCTFRVNDHVTLAHETQADDYTDDELGYTPNEPTNLVNTGYTFDETEIKSIYVQEHGYDLLTDDEVARIREAGAYAVAAYEAEYFDEQDEDVEDGDEGDEEEQEKQDTSGIKGNFTFLENAQTKLIPMTGITMKFVVLTREYGTDASNQPTKNYPNNNVKFQMEGYTWTNIYDTSTDKVDLIKPLSMIRSSMYYRDDRLYNIQEGDIQLYSVPFVKFNLMQHYDSKGTMLTNETGYTNYEMFVKFIKKYYTHYQHMEGILTTILKNVSHIDLKFYNTYGKSNNYIIGDSDEIIDRVNMSICFYVFLISGTDMVKAQDDIKTFIKETIEKLNKYGSNDMNISNLMREIENNFAYVDHLRFVGMNGKVVNGEYTNTDAFGYSTEYQTIKNVAQDLDDLDKEDRFSYVPEMLCVNKDQICLVMFEV